MNNLISLYEDIVSNINLTEVHYKCYLFVYVSLNKLYKRILW